MNNEYELDMAARIGLHIRNALAKAVAGSARDGGRRRFVIEGEWSGYTSRQRKISHRSVHNRACKALRAFVEQTPFIVFTDGTTLELTVRDCRPRERVEVLDGYGMLIRDCAFYGVNSVSALHAAREEVLANARAAREAQS